MCNQLYLEDAANKKVFDDAAKLSDVKKIKVTSSIDGHKIDVFVTRPHALKDDAAAPAYIYAHGGGGVMFTAEYANILCLLTAANLNCVVFNVDFRNGPEAKAPTGQQDYLDAVRLIFKNAAEFKIDADKICL